MGTSITTIENNPSRGRVSRVSRRVPTGPHGFPRAFLPGGFPPCKLSFFRVFRHVSAREKYCGGWSEIAPSSPTSNSQKLEYNFGLPGVGCRKFKIQLPASNFRRLECNFQLATSGHWCSTSNFRKLGCWSSLLEVEI